jgi:hypothetical protein
MLDFQKIEKKPGVFFFVGQKSSGTSLMVRLLNKHPELSCAGEADLIWILYQRFVLNRKPSQMKSHDIDGDEGMKRTLNNKFCLKILDLNLSVQDIFFSIQSRSYRVKKKSYKKVKMVGDKKPTSQIQPELLEFTLNLFPDAKFINIVRHPQASFNSFINRFTKKWFFDRGSWKYTINPDDEKDLLREHIRSEEAIDELKKNCPVHTLYYEKLCLSPNEELNELFNFLGVSNMEYDLKLSTKKNDKYAGKKISELEFIMKKHNYKPY